MKPWETIAVAETEEHVRLELRRRGDDWVIRAGSRDLMSSREHGSEEALARVGCAGLPKRGARVLVGGLGMGFTLRATLDLAPRDARVVVAEISAAVVAWNRGELAMLSRRACDDPRVTVRTADVRAVAEGARGEGGFDAILLDVDNGPEALARPENERLYDRSGLACLAGALSRCGVLCIWSASEAPELERRMKRAGLEVELHRASASPSRRARRHVIFAGRVGSPSP